MNTSLWNAETLEELPDVKGIGRPWKVLKADDDTHDGGCDAGPLLHKLYEVFLPLS